MRFSYSFRDLLHTKYKSSTKAKSSRRKIEHKQQKRQHKQYQQSGKDGDSSDEDQGNLKLQARKRSLQQRSSLAVPAHTAQDAVMAPSHAADSAAAAAAPSRGDSASSASSQEASPLGVKSIQVDDVGRNTMTRQQGRRQAQLDKGIPRVASTSAVASSTAESSAISERMPIIRRGQPPQRSSSLPSTRTDDSTTDIAPPSLHGFTIPNIYGMSPAVLLRLQQQHQQYHPMQQPQGEGTLPTSSPFAPTFPQGAPQVGFRSANNPLHPIFAATVPPEVMRLSIEQQLQPQRQQENMQIDEQHQLLLQQQNIQQLLVQQQIQLMQRRQQQQQQQQFQQQLQLQRQQLQQPQQQEPTNEYPTQRNNQSSVTHGELDLARIQPWRNNNNVNNNVGSNNDNLVASFPRRPNNDDDDDDDSETSEFDYDTLF